MIICHSQLTDPPPGFTFGTIKETSIVDYFNKSSNRRLRKIYENMKAHNLDSFNDGIVHVQTGWVNKVDLRFNKLLAHNRAL